MAPAPFPRYEWAVFDLEMIPAGSLPSTDTERLLVAAHQLAAARSLGRVMEVVRRAARDMTRADGVTFVLREGDQVFYADEEAISPLWKGSRFPAGACISGWAMDHRQTVVIEDIDRDDRIPHDLYRPTFVRSLAMIPVGAGEPVAAIGAYWARRHRATPDQQLGLEALAGFAALALANDALVRELREAVAAREEFLTIAAHELRNPLTALKLTMDRGRRAAGAADELEALRRAVVRGQAHGQRLEVLVDVLLEVSSARRGGPALAREQVDLAALVARVVERFAEQARGPLTCLRDGPLVGSWDAARLEQIVENLLTNALKFGERRPVEVSVTRQGAEARLVVHDQGIGIPVVEQARIFEKFARGVSVASYGGFGLGLWIVRQNVEAHGGTVEVESQPGAGARFTVRLPLE